MKADEVLARVERYFNVILLGEKSAGFGKVLSSETGTNILELMSGSSSKVGLSATEVSESLGIGRTTVLYHLDRMKESGMVEVNRHLASEQNWNAFWEECKKGTTDYSREEFNRLHDAKLRGEKLFVTTKKGVLFMPSSDKSSGHAMIAEAFAPLVSPGAERSYKRALSGSATLGVLGIMLLAFSFVSHPSPLDLFVTPQPAMRGGEMFMAAPPMSAEMAPETPMDAKAIAPEEEAEVVVEREAAEEVMVIDKSRPSTLPLALSYLGVLLLGCGIGIFVYARFVRRSTNA